MELGVVGVGGVVGVVGVVGVDVVVLVDLDDYFDVFSKIYSKISHYLQSEFPNPSIPKNTEYPNPPNNPNLPNNYQFLNRQHPFPKLFRLLQLYPINTTS